MTQHDAATLFTLAKKISRLFAEPAAELLHSEDHSNLMEYETKLLAYANLLSVENREQFLAAEVQNMRAYLSDMLLRYRRSRQPRSLRSSENKEGAK
jgi:hypothetical protein